MKCITLTYVKLVGRIDVDELKELPEWDPYMEARRAESVEDPS